MSCDGRFRCERGDSRWQPASSLCLSSRGASCERGGVRAKAESSSLSVLWKCGCGVGRTVTHACGASGDKSACGAMTELRYVRTARAALDATRSLTVIVLPSVGPDGRGEDRSLSMIARQGPFFSPRNLEMKGPY